MSRSEMTSVTGRRRRSQWRDIFFASQIRVPRGTIAAYNRAGGPASAGFSFSQTPDPALHSANDRALRESDVEADPLVQFRRWLTEAAAAGAALPEAMTLATATPDGRPSARMVLLRGCDE